MGTKTIGVREETYDRLNARKREDESFTDLMERLLAASKGDWRDGFGTLSADDANDLESLVEASRRRTSHGLEARQRKATDGLSDIEEDR
ncbi:MAG: antitoxin VapB family protein [Halorhabdus sp.]